MSAPDGGETDAEVGGQQIGKKMSFREGAVSFGHYALKKYLAARESIILDALVGGMFLSFLMDTADNCDDESFTNIFFVIGILHFISNISSNLADYGKRAAEADGEETWLEVKTRQSCEILQHIVKALMFPCVAALGWYVVKFNSRVEGIDWIFSRDETDGCGRTCFCDRNYVNLATLVFVFQLIVGAVKIGVWYTLWYIDREDDEAEQAEEREWKAEQERQKNTVWGKLWGIVILIGLHGFYNPGVAGLLLSLSVALPHENCNLHVTEWFLYSGVIFTLTEFLTSVQGEVEEGSSGDGIVNKAEHRLIDGLKLLKLPLFIFELVCFFNIVYRVVKHGPDVKFNKDPEKPALDQHYCELGVWRLMLAMTGIYSIVLVFRILVVVASLVDLDEAEKIDEAASDKAPDAEEGKPQLDEGFAEDEADEDLAKPDEISVAGGKKKKSSRGGSRVEAGGRGSK